MNPLLLPYNQWLPYLHAIIYQVTFPIFTLLPTALSGLYCWQLILPHISPYQDRFIMMLLYFCKRNVQMYFPCFPNYFIFIKDRKWNLTILFVLHMLWWTTLVSHPGLCIFATESVSFPTFHLALVYIFLLKTISKDLPIIKQIVVPRNCMLFMGLSLK